MSNICPSCSGEYVYFDGTLHICPECNFEFTEADLAAAKEAAIVRDANGNPIQDGDTLTITQDIKISGSKTIKRGTKAKNVKVLAVPVNGHELEASIEGFGRLYLYARVVKK